VIPLYLSGKAILGNLETNTVSKGNNRSYPVPWDPNSLSPPTVADTVRRKRGWIRAELLSPGEQQAPAASQGSFS